MTEIQPPIEAVDTEKNSAHLTTDNGYYPFYDVDEEKLKSWGYSIRSGRGFTAKGFYASGDVQHIVFAPGVVTQMRVDTYVD